MDAEQVKLDLPTPRPIERNGWLQRLLGGSNQVDSEQAIELAHQKYAAYCQSQDIALVDEAFKHYMQASAGIRRREWRLLYGCTSAALARYMGNGRTQQDLAKLIPMGNEVMASWTSTMEPPGFGVRIAYVIARANKDVWFQSIQNGGVDESTGEEAFKLSQKCFEKVIEDDDRVGNSSRVARIELGIMIAKRCRQKKITQGLDTAIAHLEHALKQVNQLEETPSKNMDTLRIASQLTQAYYALYIGQVGNRMNYIFTQSRRLNSVDSALEHLETTRIQSEKVKGTKIEPPKLQLMFGTLHVLRWLETKKQSDAENARTVLKTARAMEGVDEGYKLIVDKLLTRVEAVTN